jgi:hypothetical protein
MSVSTRIVKLAAATLPTAQRDRYREQWLADLQDAPEQNVKPAQIALGAAAFAVTVGRPLPRRPELGPAAVDRRARLARGLAFSAALVGLSQYASMPTLLYLGDNRSPEQPAVDTFMPIVVYAVLGTVLALLVAFGTRGMPTRVRWSVALLAVAVAAPIVQSFLNADLHASWNPPHHPGSLGYLIAAILIVVALGLVRERRRDAAANPWSALGVAVALLTLGGLTLLNAVVLWSRRPPLLFGNGPRNASNPIYVDWLRLKEQFESLTTSIFVWWSVGLVVAVAALFIVTVSRRLSPGAGMRLAIGVASVITLAGGSLVGFLESADVGIVPPGEVTLFLAIGRLALVGVTLSCLVPQLRMQPQASTSVA